MAWTGQERHRPLAVGGPARAGARARLQGPAAGPGPEEGVPDITIAACAVALLGIGVVMVFSASYTLADSFFGDPYYFLKRQAFSAVLGLIGMALMVRVDYHLLRRFAIPGVLVAYALLALVLALGQEIGGSKRWIDLGLINLQSSEVAKLALVNFLAAYAAANRERMHHLLFGLILPMAVVGIAFGLIMLEPDLGTGGAIVITAGLVLFVGGASVTHLGLLAAAGLPGVALLVWLEPYRMKRILAFIDPWAAPTDYGWNVIQSLLAIGSGGLFGLGLGNSRQKFAYLPAQHTDFIYAILAEELGFVGAAAVLALFFVLGWRGLRAAIGAPDSYGSLLAVGLTGMLVFQALINIGVVTSTLPVTGIPLPFMSYGGSSLVFSLAAVGILLNISRQASGAVGR